MPEGSEAHEDLRTLDDVVIFTTTRYGTDKQSLVRQELGLRLLENASTLGIRTVVVDGGSNEGFVHRAAQFPNVTVIPEPAGSTMGSGRRLALEEAMKLPDARVFLWVEPEKDELINKETLGDMVEHIKGAHADIVVPARRENAGQPRFQKWIESRANARARQLIQSDGIERDEIDFWFGPKMFSREAARYFSGYTGVLDKWDAIMKPVMQAARDGKKIVSVDVDYKYDRSQVAAEENDREMKAKRVDQYRQILAELGDEFWRREGKGVESGAPKRTKLR